MILKLEKLVFWILLEHHVPTVNKGDSEYFMVISKISWNSKKEPQLYMFDYFFLNKEFGEVGRKLLFGLFLHKLVENSKDAIVVCWCSYV